jgi:hypothetical protein
VLCRSNVAGLAQYFFIVTFVIGDAIDEDGDPPRVWSTAGNYPGTAFTRSFGDSVAESIGVFAEPEILTRYISRCGYFGAIYECNVRVPQGIDRK